MQSLFLVVLLAAAATAAVVKHDVVKVVELPERVEGDTVADGDVNEMPIVIVSNEDDLNKDTAVATRRNINLGTIGIMDTKLPTLDIGMEPLTNGHRVWENTIRTTQPITAIRVNQVNGPHDATATLLAGGLGQFSATINIRSALNRGFRYTIIIYTGWL